MLDSLIRENHPVWLVLKVLIVTHLLQLSHDNTVCRFDTKQLLIYWVVISPTRNIRIHLHKMTFNIEVFSKRSFVLGEGPHWYKDKLYFVDIMEGSVGFLDSCGAFHFLYKEKDDNISSVFQDDDDDKSIVFTTNLGIHSLNTTTGIKKLIATNDDNRTKLNDAKCDSRNRLWIGSVGPSPGNSKSEQGFINLSFFFPFFLILKALYTSWLVRGNLRKS